MKHFLPVVARVALVVAFVMTASAQEAPPKEPFKAIHLVKITSEADVAAMQATLADLNAVIAKEGYRDIRYRLYKVTGSQAGSYNYLVESSWSGGDAYDKVHKSAEWLSTTKKHSDFERITKEQVYNRYVEVQSTKR